MIKFEILELRLSSRGIVDGRDFIKMGAGEMCGIGEVFGLAGTQAVSKESARVKARGSWGLNALQWVVHSRLKGSLEQELEWSESEF